MKATKHNNTNTEQATKSRDFSNVLKALKLHPMLRADIEPDVRPFVWKRRRKKRTETSWPQQQKLFRRIVWKKKS